MGTVSFFSRYTYVGGVGGYLGKTGPARWLEEKKNRTFLWPNRSILLGHNESGLWAIHPSFNVFIFFFALRLTALNFHLWSLNFWIFCRWKNGYSIHKERWRHLRKIVPERYSRSFLEKVELWIPSLFFFFFLFFFFRFFFASFSFFMMIIFFFSWCVLNNTLAVETSVWIRMNTYGWAVMVWYGILCMYGYVTGAKKQKKSMGRTPDWIQKQDKQALHSIKCSCW